MSGQLSTKETKEALLFAFKLGGAVKASLADGKVDFTDAGHFLSLIPSLGGAVEGIDKVPAEIKDLDAAEIAELEAMLMTQVGTLVGKAKLIEQINAGLKMVHAIHAFYVSVK